MDWFQEMEMNEEEEHQDQSTSVGDGRVGREGRVVIFAHPWSLGSIWLQATLKLL